MARVIAYVNPNIGEKILRHAQDAIIRDMHRRGVNVQEQARENLRSGPVPRHWTGNLSRDIRVSMFRYKKSFGARVETDLYYAAWVHNGTGIFGPRKKPIIPTHSPYLKFIPKGGSRVLRKPSVKGMEPNPFLKDALSAAAP